MARNPLRLDPSRTNLLVKEFARDIQRRFAALDKVVCLWILARGEVGVSNASGAFVVGVIANAPYPFKTSPKKIKDFQAWLQRQVNAKILTVPKNLKGQPWTSTYVKSAWKKGALRAYTDARPNLGQSQPFYEGSKAEFLRSSFDAAERTSKIQMLYTRTYETLKGISSQMSSQMAQVLADGMAHGKHPVEIARMMSKTISGMSRVRAMLIAQTEIMHSHAEGQLDGFEELGIERVGADVEFSTSDDSGVCEECASLQGELYTIEEARGVIPAHPRCRCSWVPAPVEVPDED